MARTPIIGVVSAALMLSAAAFAQQFGTPDEAKAMLLKAVATVKADKAKALDMFAKGEGGFLDRDLYPFCFNISDGKIHPFANPNGKQLFGQDTRNNKDSPARRLGWNNLLPRRSRKVNSPRSATCSPNRVPTRHRFRR
jgi:hypothetical protein